MSFAFPKEIVITKQFQIVNGNNSNQSVTFDPDISSVFSSLEFVNVLNNTFPDAGFVLEDDQYLSEENAKNLFIEKIGGALEGSFNIIGDLDVSGSFSLVGNTIFNGDVDINGNLESNSNFNLGKVLTLYDALNISGGGYKDVNNLNEGFRPILIGNNVNIDSSTKPKDSITIGNFSGLNRTGTQGQRSISIGNYVGHQEQGIGSIGLGYYSAHDTQGNYAVSIGYYDDASGQTNQSNQAVSIGKDAGNTAQGNNAVSIGSSAGKTSQGDFNVAIGANAGKDTQATKAIAIGYNSGTNNQSLQSVSIGTNAGETSQGLNSIALGTNAALNTQGVRSVAIGDAAGQKLQGSKSIAIGYLTGRNNQSDGSVAIGEQAANTEQGINSVAIGNNSAKYNQSTNSIAIGANSGIGNATDNTKGQAPYCVAIGSNSGTTNQGLATGYSIAIGNQSGETDQGDYSVAIGHQSALTTQGTNSVAIGYLTGRTNQSYGSVAIGEQAANAEQGINSVAVGSNSGKTSQSTHSIAIGDQAGFDTQGGTTGYSIAIGDQAGKSNQSFKSVAIGNQAGLTSQGGTTGYSIAIGNASGQTQQTEYAIAIGANAGNNLQKQSSIAIGRDAGKENQQTASIAIGYLSGRTNQNSYSIGLGTQAAFTGQSSYAIAIGAEAGKTNQSGSSIALGYQTGYTAQNTNAVAIGREAGKTSQGADTISIGNYLDSANNGQHNQGTSAISFGRNAGKTDQGVDSIAIGRYAANTNQSTECIAIGMEAGQNNQDHKSIAMGWRAAYDGQGHNSVAIGLRAGEYNQGEQSIAVGFDSGQTNQGNYSIAMGFHAGSVDQHANTIILNANTTDLNSSGTSRFYVKPIRNTDTQDTFLRYNATSGEITHHLDLNMPNNGLIKFNNDSSTAGPNKIQLWGNGQYGFGIGSLTVKYSSKQKHTFYYNPSTTNNVATNNGTLGMELDNSNLKVSGKIGINNNNITPTYELDIKGISHTGSEGFHSGRILHYYPLNSLSGFTQSGSGAATIENNDYAKLTNNDVSITSPSISIRGYTHFKENGTYTANAAGNNILGYTSQRILVKLNAQFYSQDGNTDYFSIHLLNSSGVQIAEIYKVYNSTQSTSVGFVPIVCDITPYLIENLHNIKIKISSNGGSGDYVLVKNLTICVDDSTPWYNFSAKQVTITDKLSIGNTNPSVTLDITATDAIKIPVGTTGQRPTTSGSSHYGYIRYNTTNSSYEGFGAGNAWGSLGGVKDVDQDTYISAETSAGADNDQLKFFTANNQRMIISNDGKVGIGTNSPSQLLHIYGAQKNFLLQTTNNNQDNNNSILFQNSGTSYSWRIGRRYNSTINESNKCNFVISGGNIETNYENLNDRFTIGENGNVGIGTNNPIEKLHVKDGNIIIHSANPSLYVMAGGTGTIAGTTNFLRAHSTTTTNYIDYKIGNLHFRSNSSGRMTLTAAGNLGIGTDNPTQKLDVRGNIYSTGSGQFTGGSFNSENNPPGVYLGSANSQYGNIQIISNQNTGGWVDFTDNIAGSGTDFDGRIRYGSNVGFDFFTNASTTARMHIDLSGNVGIGKTPASKLDVNGSIRGGHNTNTTSYFGRAAIGYASYNGWASFSHLDRASAGNYAMMQHSTGQTLINASSNKSINFKINNVDKMVMLASGNFGIGTSNPQSKLDVNGDINITGSGVLKMDGVALVENSNNANPVDLYYNCRVIRNVTRQDGMWINFNSSGTTNADLRLFAGGDVERMRIDAYSGNVGIGTSSPTAKLHLNDSPVDSTIYYIPNSTTSTYTHFDKSIQFSRTNTYRNFYIGLLGNNTNNGNVLAFGGDGGGGSDPNIGMTLDSNGRLDIGSLGGGLNVVGNVGFGTTSPTGKLHISSGSSGDCELILEADTDNNDDGDVPKILFRQDGGNDWSMIGADYYGANNTEKGHNANALTLANSVSPGGGGGIIFKTNDSANGYTNAIERMKISPSGNVGIGTTSPSYKLDVRTTSSAIAARFGYAGGNTHGTGQGIVHITGEAEGAQAILRFGVPNGADGAHKTAIIAKHASATGSWSRSDLYFCLNNNGNNNTASENATTTHAKMIIKSGGDVGIGTTSPTEKLHVAGNIKLTGNLITSSKTISQAELGYLDGVTSSIQTQINAAAGSGGGAFTTSGNNCYFNGAGGVNIGENNAPSARLEINDSAGRSIRFGTGSSINVHHMDYYSGNDRTNPFYINFYSGEDVHICAGTQGGNVGIGKTPASKLDVNGSIRAYYDTNNPSYFGRAAIGGHPNYSDWASFSHLDKVSLGNYAMMQNSAGQVLLNSSLGQVIKFRNNNIDRMILSSAGNFGIGTTNPGNKLVVVGQTDSTTFNATSDMRYKENICPLENPLEKICQIQGVNFNFIEDEDENKKKHAGIIAQEVYKIIPEAIDTKNDDKWTANYNTFIGYLIESVKSLKKENDELKEDNVEKDKKINNLENKIENMATDISAIKEMLKM